MKYETWNIIANSKQVKETVLNSTLVCFVSVRDSKELKTEHWTQIISLLNASEFIIRVWRWWTKNVYMSVAPEFSSFHLFSFVLCFVPEDKMKLNSPLSVKRNGYGHSELVAMNWMMKILIAINNKIREIICIDLVLLDIFTISWL